MKKILLFIILLLPFVVNAEEKVYEICQDGCEYNSVQEVFDLIRDPYNTNSVPEMAIYDLTIIIKDDATYNVDFREFREYSQVGNQNYFGTGYVTNTNAYKFTLKGVDPEHRPTIYSGTDQMSFWFKYGKELIFENIIMKNVETDNSFHGGDLFIMGSREDDTVKMINSEMHTIDCFNIWANSIEVRDSDFYIYDGAGFDGSDGDVILDNLNIKAGTYVSMTSRGTVRASNIDIDIDNVDNANFSGIEVYGGGTNYLENIKIKDAINGLYVYGSYDERYSSYKGYVGVTYVDNCDFTGNDISIEANGNNVGNDYDIIVRNSKIDNVKSEGDKRGGDSLLGPIIYVEGSTKWTNEIERSTEDGFGNAIELTDGRIIIEQSDSVTITVDDGKYDEVVLSAIFKFNGFNNYKWTSSDEEIVKLENDKIIPGKEGTAYILGTYANSDDVYKLEVVVKHKVKEEEKEVINPNTRDVILVVFGLLVVSSIGFVIGIKHVNKKIS